MSNKEKQKTVINFPNTDWQSVEFFGTYTKLSVESKDKDNYNYTEILMDCGLECPINVWLDQEQLKVLIAHLQKQIIPSTELRVHTESQEAAIKRMLNKEVG